MAQFSIAPVSALLGTSAGTIYTVPAGVEQTLTISINNSSSASATASLWIVESGGTRGLQHARLVDYAVNGKEPRKLIERESFPPGTMIVAGSSVANLIGIQITGTSRSVA